jgi:hypothetical protein
MHRAVVQRQKLALVLSRYGKAVTGIHTTMEVVQQDSSAEVGMVGAKRIDCRARSATAVAATMVDSFAPSNMHSYPGAFPAGGHCQSRRKAGPGHAVRTAFRP